MPEKTVQKEPGKKPAPSKKPKPQQEVVVQIPLSELHPFPDHPFQVREDASMQETAESVKEYGVLVPALARPREDGGYELIAGHRRKHACELAGLATMPVIVRDIDRDAATIIMVDSNLQRENILPSERAKAYKMKMEAIKRQGARTDLTSPKISAKFRSDDEVGQDAGVSGDTIRNYIALTQLSTSCGSCESITRSCGKSCWSWIAVRWHSSAPARWDSSSRTGAWSGWTSDLPRRTVKQPDHSAERIEAIWLYFALNGRGITR